MKNYYCKNCSKGCSIDWLDEIVTSHVWTICTKWWTSDQWYL